jgi:hypothetical protein
VKTLLISAIVLVGLAAVPSIARAEAKRPGTICHEPRLLEAYSANYHAVRQLHGKRAPGRNIRKYGRSSTRPSTCRHVARSLRTLRSMRFRGSRLLTATAPRVAPAGTATLRGTGAPLAAIRACESGGNYSTDTGNGFGGAYQFDQQTWNSVGGSGNPAQASPAEQDKRAAMLYAQRGSSPWPVCGR